MSDDLGKAPKGASRDITIRVVEGTISTPARIQVTTGPYCFCDLYATGEKEKAAVLMLVRVLLKDTIDQMNEERKLR